jgi:hypothetical protein
MSTGGSFTLVTNDGRMDQMLLASSILRDNINAIRAEKIARNERDTAPELADLERSHVLHVNAHYKPYVAITLEYFKVSQNNVNLGSEITVSIPQYGDFFADMVLNVVINTPTTGYSGTSVDASDCVLYQHCEYPGERLLEETRFEINSNPIDSYENTSYVFHRQFMVPPHKRVAWDRCMGQEQSSVATVAVPDTTSVTTAPVTQRTKLDVYNGYQTLKESHPNLNLWIPLLFWFNTDPRLAFPSVAVPYGQRFLIFRLTAASNLFRAIINPAATTSLTSPTYSTPQVSTFDLYINNLFLLPEVHDIFIDRVAFTLIRVHRIQNFNLNKSTDQIHLNQLKWPLETFWWGFQPVVNTTINTNISTTGSQASVVCSNMTNWHRMCQVTDSVNQASSTVNGASTKLNIKRENSHITKVKLEVHSVAIFQEYPAEFFNQYIPLTYGGSNICAPSDPGMYMYSFSLYPGDYQPSGHFNTSRAREIYLHYTSSYIDSSHPASLILHGRCLNFLLITEGSSTLRYST